MWLRMEVGFIERKTQNEIRVYIIKHKLNASIYSLDWPPSSPDLNPIENVWRILKQRLRSRKPYGGWSLKDLKEAVFNIWNNKIKVEDFNKYIDSLPERLKKVRFRKGAQTHW